MLMPSCAPTSARPPKKAPALAPLPPSSMKLMSRSNGAQSKPFSGQNSTAALVARIPKRMVTVAKTSWLMMHAGTTEKRFFERRVYAEYELGSATDPAKAYHLSGLTRKSHRSAGGHDDRDSVYHLPGYLAPSRNLFHSYEIVWVSQ